MRYGKEYKQTSEHINQGERLEMWNPKAEVPISKFWHLFLPSTESASPSTVQEVVPWAGALKHLGEKSLPSHLKERVVKAGPCHTTVTQAARFARQGRHHSLTEVLCGQSHVGLGPVQRMVALRKVGWEALSRTLLGVSWRGAVGLTSSSSLQPGQQLRAESWVSGH